MYIYTGHPYTHYVCNQKYIGMNSVTLVEYHYFISSWTDRIGAEISRKNWHKQKLWRPRVLKDGMDIWSSRHDYFIAYL